VKYGNKPGNKGHSIVEHQTYGVLQVFRWWHLTSSEWIHRFT